MRRPEWLRQKFATEFLTLPAGEQWRQALFWLFWTYMVIFASGYAVRDVFPLLCAICLIGYYRRNWRESTLQRFPMRWLFLFFWGLAVWGVIISQDIWQSFIHVGRNLNKAFILPFIAMECARDEKDLRRLIWAVVLACLWQGADGLWQAATGKDFIHGMPPASGRLTGSFSDYVVGNFIALTLIPAAGAWFLLREQHGRVASLILLTLLLGPALYLLYFSYTRNGYLTILAAAVLWACLIAKRMRTWWVALLFAVGALLTLAVLTPQRLGPGVISEDGRWELWGFAWEVFRQFPVTGAGFGQYNAAFRDLGLSPTRDAITISHPHNIYLQLLCESGVAGFALGMAFLLGMLYWGWRRIREPLEAESAAQGKTSSIRWRFAALLWCGWGAYLISGVFGHDFFRDWWHALAMTHLGIMIGAVVNACRLGPHRPFRTDADAASLNLKA